MEKHTIIRLKQEGNSNRKVAEILRINRKTVVKYWNEFNEAMGKLNEEDADIALLQESVASLSKYDSSTRKANKYTPEMDKFLDNILKQEEEKDSLLGNHKQKLTHAQIYQKIRDAGHDIGKTTIADKIKQKRDKRKECFIKQLYDFGDRLEYDFGEAKLVIGGTAGTYHMAVLSSPAGEFRWAYLYKNQKQDVFNDSHIRFFDMVGGSCICPPKN